MQKIDLNGKNILVTGSPGFIGANLVMRLLREMNESEGTAMLVVTHDPVVAACAQKVRLMKDGRIAGSHDTKGDASRVAKLYLEMYR